MRPGRLGKGEGPGRMCRSYRAFGFLNGPSYKDAARTALAERVRFMERAPTPYFARIGTMNRDGAVVGQPSRLSSRASRPRRILGRDAPAAGGTPAPLPRFMESLRSFLRMHRDQEPGRKEAQASCLWRRTGILPVSPGWKPALLDRHPASPTLKPFMERAEIQRRRSPWF